MTHIGQVNSKYFYDEDNIWTNLGKTKCENTNCNKEFSKDKINLIVQSSSYLKFDPQEGEGADTKQWLLKCSTCDETIHIIAGTDYTTINSLKTVANSNNTVDNICKALRLPIKEISYSELNAYYTKYQLVLVGSCDVKWDYSDNKVHYSYSNLKCELCNTLVSILDTLQAKEPTELFPLLSCNTCNYNFTA